MSEVKIPKRIGHIWVGHLPPPTDWMDSWRDFHPDWEYVLYDNDYLFSRKWRNQRLIKKFFERKEYCGVADLMRYEILFQLGGFLPEADSICLRATDELWAKEALYTVYEHEVRKPGLVSPFLASVPGHGYLQWIILRAERKNRGDNLDVAWRSVGNRFLMQTMLALPPEQAEQEVVIFPSHYFNPCHKGIEERRYDGDGPVYCEQLWGTTRGMYPKPDGSLGLDALHKGHMAALDAHLE